MNQIDIVSKIQSLLKERKITYFWDCYNDGSHTYFSYTVPELGIMVNEQTFKDTVERVVEMLEYLKMYYDNDCKPQDELEKALVNKAFLLYNTNKIEFLKLFGLD